jgi:hypothetical protein
VAQAESIVSMQEHQEQQTERECHTFSVDAARQEGAKRDENVQQKSTRPAVRISMLGAAQPQPANRKDPAEVIRSGRKIWGMKASGPSALPTNAAVRE